MAAKVIGVKAIIVMPRITPDIKVQAVRARGARVILKGDAFDEALEHALELIKEHGYTYVPPYDDPDVIAGQGTVAMEILRQHPNPIHAIFVPVGGGGLIAGNAAYGKNLGPGNKIMALKQKMPLLKSRLEKQKGCIRSMGIFAEACSGTNW